MAASITASQLRAEIFLIINGANLHALSSKKVRSQLEEKFETDFTSRKKELDDLVMDVVDEIRNNTASNNSNSETDEPPVKKEKKKIAKKKIKKTIKDQSGKDDSDEEGLEKAVKTECGGSDNNSELNDEEFARQLQNEEKNSQRRSASRKCAAKETKPKAKPKSKSKEGQEGKKKRETTYTKKCALSGDLAEVVGAETMERHMVVKRMWEIARERELFDPTNKRYVICDDQLQKIIGCKRFLMFGIMKYLKHHIRDVK